MFRRDRATCATVALLALACCGATAAVDARTEEAHHEYRAPERARPTARHAPEARQSHGRYVTRTEVVHPAAGHVSSPPVHAMNYAGTTGRGTTPAVHEVSHSAGGPQVRAVHYGRIGSGTFERTVGPGLVSRSVMSGGHVLYTRLYQSHVWHQFGRTFAYETFVPAMRYPPAYYGWALAAWPHPIAYSWGWQAQAWYPRYGVLFAPYPVYSSPDLWMTDYILAQNMQTAYVQTATPAAQLPVPPSAPAVDPAAAMPSTPPDDNVPSAGPGEAPLSTQSSDAPAAPSSGEVAPVPSSNTPRAPAAAPPPITPAIKAQLDTQIKVQLQDREAATATPATLTTDGTPPSLRANHVFFQVVQPLNVPSGTSGRYCSLSPNDYIKRTGGVRPDDWMIPVVVELSAASDCPVGLHTRIGLNDLNAMENEQEAQVMDALQAASKSMGPNGPPNTPGVRPTLIASGSAAPDLDALRAIQQAQ